MCVRQRASECARLNALTDRYFVFIIQSNMTDFNGHSLFYEIIAVCRCRCRCRVYGAFFSEVVRPQCAISYFESLSISISSSVFPRCKCVCVSVNCVNIVKCSKSNYLLFGERTKQCAFTFVNEIVHSGFIEFIDL